MRLRLMLPLVLLVATACAGQGGGEDRQVLYSGSSLPLQGGEGDASGRAAGQTPAVVERQQTSSGTASTDPGAHAEETADPRTMAAAAPFEAAADAFGEGAVVALVKGLTPRQALALLAPDAALPLAPAQEVREWAWGQADPYGTALEAGVRDGWTLVVEQNGYRAVDGDNLRRLSAAGTAVALYRSVNADMTFQYARGGRLLRDVDPLLYDREAAGRLPEEEGLPFGWPGSPTAAGLALMARLTGVSLTADDLRLPSDRVAVGIHPG